MSRKIEANDDFRAVVICALRYCLGRRTYMPGLVTRWVRGNCNGILTGDDIGVMLEDIDWQRRHGSLGDSCDVQVWEQFEEWLKEQKGESK